MSLLAVEQKILDGIVVGVDDRRIERIIVITRISQVNFDTPCHFPLARLLAGRRVIAGNSPSQRLQS